MGQDNKAAPTAEKLAGYDHFALQKSPASPLPNAFSLRPAAVAAGTGLLRWNDKNLELAKVAAATPTEVPHLLSSVGVLCFYS